MNKARALTLIVCAGVALILSFSSDVIGERWGVWAVIGAELLWWSVVAIALFVLAQVVNRKIEENNQKVK